MRVSYSNDDGVQACKDLNELIDMLSLGGDILV